MYANEPCLLKNSQKVRRSPPSSSQDFFQHTSLPADIWVKNSAPKTTTGQGLKSGDRLSLNPPAISYL